MILSMGALTVSEVWEAPEGHTGLPEEIENKLGEAMAFSWSRRMDKIMLAEVFPQLFVHPNEKAGKVV